jgi:hypothetical protein
MKPYFDNHSTSGITIDELDHKLQQSQEEVLSIGNNLHSSVWRASLKRLSMNFPFVSKNYMTT